MLPTSTSLSGICVSLALFALSPSASAFNRWELNDVANLTLDTKHTVTFPRRFVAPASEPSITPQDPRCAIPAEPGICKGDFAKYAYNSNTKTCSLFSWGGCGLTPFETAAECSHVCSSTTSKSLNSQAQSQARLAANAAASPTLLVKTGGPTPVVMKSSQASSAAVRCSDNPCRPEQACRDSPWPVNCFKAPCPQYECLTKDDATSNLQPSRGNINFPTFKSLKKSFRTKSKQALSQNVEQQESPSQSIEPAPLVFQA